MSNPESRGTRRRTVLKTIGAAGGSIAASRLASAKRSGRSNFVGISYDTLTHEKQGKVTGHIEHHDRGISGTINFGRFKVPFGKDSPVEPENDSGQPWYVLELDDPTFTENGQPLKLEFRSIDGVFSGFATRPSGDYGNIGITTVDPSRENPVEYLQGGLVGKGEGIAPKDFQTPPSVSDGIPTATGFHNIVEKKRGEDR